MSRVLYQIHTEPIRFSTPEVITVDKWLQSFAVPNRRLYFAASAAFGPAASPIPPFSFTLAWDTDWAAPTRKLLSYAAISADPSGATPIIPPTPSSSGVYTVSGLYVTDQFTDNTVVYDYGGGVSHRTN